MEERRSDDGSGFPERVALVHEAEVRLNAGVDPRAVGAAVTVALCGHWEHDGPCRWPHNNKVDGRLFRTLFVCEPEKESHVRDLIRAALVGSSEWRVIRDRARYVATDERSLADDLLRVSRRV